MILLFKRFSLSLLLIFSWGAAAHAQVVQVEVGSQSETITLQLPATTQKVFTLDNPPRLVVDTDTMQRAGISLPKNYRGTLIKSVRVGQFNPQTTRIVFDLTALPGNQPQVIPGLAAKNTIQLEFGRNGPAGSVSGMDTSAPVRVKKPKPLPLVIVDAGHGGRDPGARGKKGTREKDVVLGYALALADVLKSSGRYRVKLTRSDDTFVLLHERVKIARRAKGDLFISLHADSAPGKNIHGLSIYTLSENASDKESEKLAAEENKVDIVYGLDLSTQSEEVADILISLAQRDTNNRSATFAGNVVDSVKHNNIRLLSNSHRFAGFAVLKAPDIPSVLVELGFLSNPAEEKQLQQEAYRKQVIKALLNGIDAFFATKEKRQL